ncbi:nucleoporin NUP188 homolog [Octopus sinensis]|uniref:Nucleoporin NUP188 homolog n=1 Tax=Octopus sinensis TaxID=2607531 RepID=A0A6P7SNU1_9MOLL|nr:nucleoporin NUP188 homolog [Octopus sinensis]
MAGSVRIANQSVWQFISGTGILRPKELVAIELKENKHKILNGLLYYKRSLKNTTNLKKERKVPDQQIDFIQKLSILLGLDEVQTYDLFCSFLTHGYHNSEKNLKQILNNEQHTKGLMLKLQDYYFSERLYLLGCLKYIISNGQEISTHPYQDVYYEFLTSLQKENQLIKSLESQHDACYDADTPTWETHGPLMNKKNSLIWAIQNLKEQCELLECMLISLGDIAECDSKKFISLLDKFKNQGFGQWQKFCHVLDVSSEKYLKKIEYLQIIMILKILDFDLIQLCAKNNSFHLHPLLKDSEDFKTLDKSFRSLSGLPTHGPLLLGWTVTRSCHSVDREDERIIRKLGSQATQLKSLNYISTMLEGPHFSCDNVVSSVAYCTVYTLLCTLLDQFQEDTVGGVEVLCTVISQLLSKPSIANDMWRQGLEEGVGSFFQLAKDRFPLSFSLLMQLSIKLAAAGTESAMKVLNSLNSLPKYTEYMDKNIIAEYQQIVDITLCQLNFDRYIYSNEEFVIPAGTYGHYHMESASKGPAVVQWTFTYNCWTLLKCELQELLLQVSRSPNLIDNEQIDHACQIVNLIKSIITNVPDSVNQFEEITDLCYQIIHRFSGLTAPPLDLLGACVQTLTQVAKKHPQKVWLNMKQTGLLPYFSEYLGKRDDIFNAQGLRPGMYGTLLAGFECSQGRYPLSLAFLDFISSTLMELSQLPVDNEMSATVLFILTEVFPSFYKWRYYNATRREAIGHKCLEIFHNILDVMAKPKIDQAKKLPSLQEMCVHNLLYTEAGQSLLKVISIGLDAFNDSSCEQKWSTESKGNDLIDLIQMSFSVLNRLLLLKPPDLPLSPVERALSLPAARQQEQHIVLTVAQYIFHQHSPKLPTMAILLLKRLAVVSPMSILAILGNDAEPIRNKMLSRLAALTEDLQLKVAILELLSVCVVTQPGLIELFLNLKLEKPDNQGKKELTLGNSSCLNSVMNLIVVEKQKTYQCPPNLLCACIEFLHALWAGMRETAMSVLRTKENFWVSICAPLKGDIEDDNEGKEEMQLYRFADIKTVAYVFLILAQESYTVPRAKLDENFKAEMAVLSKGNRIKYWSTFIKNSLKEIAEQDDLHVYLTYDSVKDGSPLLLLKSWKNWLITISKLKIPGVNLTDELKSQILSDLLSSIQYLVKDDLSLYKVKLACITSATYFTVMTSWVSSMNHWREILEQLQLTLDTSFSNKEFLIPTVQIGLVASMTTLLQLQNHQQANISEQCLVSLLKIVCSMLLECVRNLFPLQTDTADEVPDKDQMTSLQRKQNTKLKLLMTSVLLLQEIIQNLKDSNSWISVLHNHLLIPTLLATVEVWIKSKQGLLFVDASLTLLLTISKTEQGANILMSAGFANHLCLSISSLYNTDDLSQKFLTSGRERNISDDQNWDNILCHCIGLYASMLMTLKYSFLKEALDFIGVHQDRLLQSLEFARINLTEPALKEAMATCGFIYQMSFYSREWKFHLPKVLSKLMTSFVYMCQAFVSLLVRPRYLQYLLEHAGSAREDLNGKHQLFNIASKPAFLAHSTHDELEQPTAQCLKIQKIIMTIVGICLSGLRQFTPDLCEILMDQSMDVSRYDPFLTIGFNAPSLQQDAQPTFGTLLACINMCMTFLPKIDPRASSPQKGNDFINHNIPKHLVLFVLENSLLLIMSQACRYLKEPTLSARDKQLLKRELGADLNTFLQSMHRHIRKGGTTPVSPCGSQPQQQQPVSNTSPTGLSIGRSTSQTGFSSNPEQAFYKLVSEFVTKVLR